MRGEMPAAPARKPPDIRICIVIPVYNNEHTVGAVFSEARAQVPDVFVVNDGSTDRTAAAIAAIPGVRCIAFETNRGKGAALRAGLAAARERGFTHAITMDADGQHCAQDLPAFIAAVRRAPDDLIIGSRRLPMETVAQPFRSSVGRRFGAFWYRFHTGRKIDDTQCGFRAYPIEAVMSLSCTHERYAWELEVMIRAAWNGTGITEIPIHLHYLPAAERISHFQPVRDFLRLSAVNSKAALTRVFLPWRTIAAPGLTARQKIVWLVRQELRANATPRRAAASLAFGVFMAISPLYGFQVLTVLAASFLFRMNRPLALIGVSISPPPLLPFIIAAAIAVGQMAAPGVRMPMAMQSWLGGIARYGPQWFIGSCILASMAGIGVYAIAYPLFRRMRTGTGNHGNSGNA
jgi:glycosyltransferase involved in cell wall biosynthesis